jgi:hypothetical protein
MRNCEYDLAKADAAARTENLSGLMTITKRRDFRSLMAPKEVWDKAID